MILIQHMDSIPFHPLRDPNRGGGGGGGGLCCGLNFKMSHLGA